MDDALARNEAAARRMVIVPVVVVAAVAGVVGVVVAFLVGVPLLAVLWVAVAVGMYFLGVASFRKAGPTQALAATRSRPVSEAEEPRLHNLVEGLCVGIGLEPPRLRIIEDDAPNALAVARAVDDADLVVTRGLLERLSLVELEAVLAHELARIRRGDAIVGALAGSVLRTPLYGWIARAVVGRGEPVEAWSDLAAVEITRYPPALASALEKLAPAPAPPVSPISHLWIHGARADGAFGQALVRVYEPAPPVAQRIEVLEEL
ncbi:MAG TPA: M48 family metalloprotease [Iamia sp.]|nr:M48 family metalloprotease [Iamia sp.]